MLWDRHLSCVLVHIGKRAQTHPPTSVSIHPASLSHCSLPVSVPLCCSLIHSPPPASQPVICSSCALQNGGWAKSSGWKWVPVCRTARAAEVPEHPAGGGGGDGLVPEQSGGDRTLCPAGEAAVLHWMLSVPRVFWLQAAEPGVMCAVCKGWNEYFSISVFLYSLHQKLLWVFFFFWFLKSK